LRSDCKRPELVYYLLRPKAARGGLRAKVRSLSIDSDFLLRDRHRARVRAEQDSPFEPSLISFINNDGANAESDFLYAPSRPVQEGARSKPDSVSISPDRLRLWTACTGADPALAHLSHLSELGREIFEIPIFASPLVRASAVNNDCHINFAPRYLWRDGG